MCKIYSKLGEIKSIPEPEIKCYICYEEISEENLH